MDIQYIRSWFPALARDQIFMDNVAGAQAVKTCSDAIYHYFNNANVQPVAAYPVSQEATSKVQRGYEALAKYVNASVDEVIFGTSTTHLARNVSTAFRFQPGDNIVLSKVDHEAHLAGWVQAAERKGIEVRWWVPSENTRSNPKLEADDLEAQGLIDNKTRVVCFTHTSNVLGSVTDVAAVSKTVKRINPTTLVSVDAVAYAPHAPIDVQAFGVDFYFFSWYKVYGPHIASAFISKASWDHIDRLGHFFLPPTSANNMLGLACGNFEFIQSIPAVCAYLSEVGWDFIKQQEETLQRILLSYIKTRPEIQLLGEPSYDRNLRVPVISFKVSGYYPQQKFVDLIYAKFKCTPTAGEFYAVRLFNDVLHLDSEDGVIRCSFLHYNTVAEVNALTRVMDEILSSKS
ncbi:cysteine desulfurase [Fusarium mexicanum]|uniref:Cysteine desulfurase n=1 Tax=Fusarium mexicanum TaxID=751941 RepID=A0A8H5MMC5_9HYPO|nr:cysteine desulfurase [Fusarium mexicanum]